ncbi:hypothetical protein LINGRAHAP2_LOCUS34384 [Linum grandiflorum]
MVVWVRFPRLPYQYYHCDVLDGLGNLIGKTVRLDSRTKNSVRGKFARIAVEIDLTLPTPKGVFVDGVWQVVEYENLPCFFRECGRFGHEADKYDRRRSSNGSVVAIPVGSATNGSNLTPTGAALIEPEGPWQTVEKRRRHSKKENFNQSNGNAKSEGVGRGKPNKLPVMSSAKSVSPINKSTLEDKTVGGLKHGESRLGQGTKPKIGPSISGLSLQQKTYVPTGGSVALSGQLSTQPTLGPTLQPTNLTHLSILKVASNSLFKSGQTHGPSVSTIQATQINSLDTPSANTSSPIANPSDLTQLLVLSSDVSMADGAVPISSNSEAAPMTEPPAHVHSQALDHTVGQLKHYDVEVPTVNHLSIIRGKGAEISSKEFALNRALRGKATRRLKPKPKTWTKSRKAKQVDPTTFD